MTTAADVWSQVEPALAEIRGEYERDSQTPWTTVREQLSTTLGSLAEPVRARLFEWLDAMSDRDRVELLTGDRLEGELSVVFADTGGREGDAESAWPEFLRTNGPAWNGTAQAWPVFRDWFAYQAEQEWVSAPANELLTVLESLDVPGRVAELARHGVVVPQPAGTGAGADDVGWVTAAQRDALRAGWGEQWAPELTADLNTRWGDGWQQHPGEHKSAWLAELIASGALPPAALAAAGPAPEATTGDPTAEAIPAGATEATTGSAVLASLPADIGSQLKAEVPGLAQLSESEIAEVVAEVLRESEE